MTGFNLTGESMTKFFRNFLAGVGSILEIAPEQRAYVRSYTAKDLDRLHRDYLRIANDVRVVFERTDKPREAHQLSLDFSHPVDSPWRAADDDASGNRHDRSTISFR